MKKSLGLLCLMFLSSTAHADYSISAGFGKNFTNSVQTEENLKIELEDDSHFTVSLDRTIDNARYDNLLLVEGLLKNLLALH